MRKGIGFIAAMLAVGVSFSMMNMEAWASENDNKETYIYSNTRYRGKDYVWKEFMDDVIEVEIPNFDTVILSQCPLLSGTDIVFEKSDDDSWGVERYDGYDDEGIWACLYFEDNGICVSTEYKSHIILAKAGLERTDRIYKRNKELEKLKEEFPQTGVYFLETDLTGDGIPEILIKESTFPASDSWTGSFKVLMWQNGSYQVINAPREIQCDGLEYFHLRESGIVEFSWGMEFGMDYVGYRLQSDGTWKQEYYGYWYDDASGGDKSCTVWNDQKISNRDDKNLLDTKLAQYGEYIIDDIFGYYNE
jgi:hypothetical protein